MLHGKTFRNGLLAASSAAALMIAAGSAQATSIGFAPGASNAGADANIHGSVDLDTHNRVDVFEWTSVNDGIISGLGAAAAAVETEGNLLGLGAVQRARSWFINITDNGAAGASTDDTFVENFSFALVDTLDDTVLGTDVYGSNFASHVFMTFSGSGTIDQISGDTTYDQDATFGLNYTSASFTMFFDPDGTFDADGAVGPRTADNADPIAIATFSGGGGSDQFVDVGGDFRANLNWNAGWDSAFTGVFTLPFGGAEASDGGAGLTAMRAGLSAVKITDQDVFRNLVTTQSGFDVSYLLTSDGNATGQSVIGVPEPGMLALFGAGLIGLGTLARRRKQAA